MSDERSRGWCYTINNYTDEDVIAVNEMKNHAQYIVNGFEEGGQNQTPHIQGFVYFACQKTFSRVKKFLGKAHIEKMKGTPQQASDYCKKDGNFQEHGELPAQGKRNDLDEIREVIKNGGGMKKVVEIATSYQSVKMAEQILKYTEKARDWKPNVKWFYGGTGTGKSRTAYEILGEECYTCLSTGKWFDGYDAHENVLVDDMRRDFMKFHELLRFIDRYAYRVETKGGTRQFLAKNIIITSAFHPGDLYETREDVGQLLRRIDEIRLFTVQEENLCD